MIAAASQSARTRHAPACPCSCGLGCRVRGPGVGLPRGLGLVSQPHAPMAPCPPNTMNFILLQRVLQLFRSARSNSSATPGWAAIQSRSRVSNPVTSSWASSSRNVESDGDLPKSVPSSSLSGWRCLLAKEQPSPSGVTLHPHQRALAAENRQDGRQQHPPLGEADTPAHPAVRQCHAEADQIACGSRGGGGLGSQGSGAVPAQLTVGADAGRDLQGQTSNRHCRLWPLV